MLSLAERALGLTGQELRRAFPLFGYLFLTMASSVASKAARDALFGALEASVRQTASRQLVRVPHHINSPAFAAALAQHFRALQGARPRARAAGR